jgi:hypothetical protein
MGKNTSSRQYTITSSGTSLQTKHTLILLLKRLALFYGSKAHEMILKIYKREGKRKAYEFMLLAGSVDTKNARN